MFTKRKVVSWLLSVIGIGSLLFSDINLSQSTIMAASLTAADLPYEVTQKSDNAHVKQGEKTILWAKLTNLSQEKWIGWDTVTKNPLRLGTVKPLDRQSGFFTLNNWKTNNRVHWADQKEADYKQEMSFGFYVSAPSNLPTGKYTECFAPVIEGISWLSEQDVNGRNLCWDIFVDQNTQTYAGESAGESIKNIDLTLGEEKEVTFQAKNIGGISWAKEGDNPVHLGTIDPIDKSSKLFDNNTWINDHRLSKMTEAQVANGQTGNFTFKITTPSDAKVGDSYHDKFWLVSENNTWFNRNSDQYFGLNVNIVENKSNPEKKSNVGPIYSGGSSGGGNNNNGGSGNQTLSVDLKANENDQTITVDINSSITLKWTSSGATSCSASDDWSGAKSAAGSETINNLTSDKKFTLNCSTNNNTVSDSVWVKINHIPLGEVSQTNCNSTAQQVSVSGNAKDDDHANQPVQVKFYLNNPKNLSGRYIGETQTNGNQFTFSYIDSNFVADTSQKIFAYAADLDNSSEYLIGSQENIVCSAGTIQSPTVDLRLDGGDQTKTVVANTQIALSWTSDNAASCSADWTSKTTSSGSETVTAAQNKIYSMTCSGAGGTSNPDNVEVKVVDAIVSLAADSPMGSTLPKGASNVEMAKFKFNGAGTINNLDINYLGTNIDSLIHVYLYEGNRQIATGSRNGSIFEFDNINWSFDTTKYLSIKGDTNAAAITGSTLGFSINSASNISDLQIGGNFPVQAELFTIGDHALSQVIIEAQTNPADPRVGEYAELASFRINSGNDDIVLNQINLTQNGTISNADLSNLKLYQGATILSSVASMDGDKIKFNLSTPYSILNETSRIFTVKGTTAGQSDKTVKIYLSSTMDISITDSAHTYGSPLTNNYDGTIGYSQVTLQGGIALTISNNGPAAANITRNANQTMLDFAISAGSRQIEIRKIPLKLQGISGANGSKLKNGSTNYFSNIKVWQTDSSYSSLSSVLEGPNSLNDASCISDTECDLTLTSTFYVDSSSTKYLKVTWDVADNTVFDSNNETYRIDLKNWDATSFRYTDSSSYVNLADVSPSTGFSGNNMIVFEPRLRIYSSDLVSSHVAASSQQNVDAAAFNFEILGGSGTNTVNSIKIQGYVDNNTEGAFTEGNYATIQLRDIVQNIKLFHGDTQIGTAQNATSDGTINFANLNWQIPSNSTAVLKLVFDISSSAPYGGNANRVAFDIKTAQTDVNVTDQDSNSIKVIGNEANGGINPNTFVTIAQPSNNPPIGQISQISCNSYSNNINIQGSAQDPDDPNQNIKVRFYLGGIKNVGTYMGETTANGANHSFNFDYQGNPAFGNGSTQKVYAYGLDLLTNNEFLIDSEENVTCTQPSNNPPIGQITQATCNSSLNTVVINGNAQDPDQPSERILVSFYLGTENDPNVYLGGTQTDANGDFEFSYTPANLSEKTISVFGEDTLNHQYYLMDTQTGIICQDSELLGSLHIQRNNATPNSNIILSSISNLEIGRFDLAASGEDIRVQKIGLKIGDNYLNKQAINNIYINHGTTNIPATYFSSNDIVDNYAIFDYLDINIAKDNTVSFKVIVDLKTMDSSGSYSGRKVDVAIDDDVDLLFTGQTSGTFGNRYENHVDADAEAKSNTMVIHKTKPTVSKDQISDFTLDAGTKDVYKFSVTADQAGNIEFGKFNLNYSKTGNYNIDSCSVYRSETKVSDGIIGSDKISFIFSSPQTLSSAQYVVRCAFSGNFNNNDSFDSHLDTDSPNYVTNNTFQNLSTANSNLIWSDLSNSSHLDISHNPSSSDFTNGLYINNLSLSSNTLIYSSASGGEGAGIIFSRSGHLYKINLDGSNEVQLTFDNTDGNPEISSDGWVYFDRSRSGGSHNIWKMRTDGSQPTKITDDNGNDTNPILGGGKIFFKSNRTSGHEYYQSDLDGSNIVALDLKNNSLLGYTGAFDYHNTYGYLTTGTVYCGPGGCQYFNLYDYQIGVGKIEPSFSGTASATDLNWSTDGSKLLFTCGATETNCGTPGSVYVYDALNSQKTLIRNSASKPSFSTNNQIVFINSSSGHINLMNIDGTGYIDLNVSGNNPKYTSN